MREMQMRKQNQQWLVEKRTNRQQGFCWKKGKKEPASEENFVIWWNEMIMWLTICLRIRVCAPVCIFPENMLKLTPRRYSNAVPMNSNAVSLKVFRNSEYVQIRHCFWSVTSFLGNCYLCLPYSLMVNTLTTDLIYLKIVPFLRFFLFICICTCGRTLHNLRTKNAERAKQ